MTGRRQAQPQHPRVRINTVPHPPGSGNLVLPLFEDSVANLACTELTFKWMLAAVTTPGIACYAVPRDARSRRSRGTEFLPAIGRVVGGVSEVPTTQGWGWSDTLAPFRHALPVWTRDPIAFTIDRRNESFEERRLGIDFRRRPPLREKLGEGREALH